MDIIDDKSLFQQTVLENRFFYHELIVVGNTDNYRLLKNLEEIDITDCREIVEATPRNIAAAVAFPAFF